MSRRIVLVIALTVGILGIVLLPSVAGLDAASAESGAAIEDSAVAQTSVDCSACHDDPAKVDFPNSDVCTQCHVNIGLDYQKSVHSEKTNTHANFACMECHEEPEDTWFMHFQRGPHGEQTPGVTNSPEATCSQSMCHDDQNPYGPVYAEWDETGDADWSQDMLSHSKPAPPTVRTEECSACHGTHEGSLANIEGDTAVDGFALGEQPDPNSVEEWRITCSACHDPHDVQSDDVLRGDFETEGELCAQCHTGSVTDQLDVAHAEGTHQSIWELYSGSEFADAEGRHTELDCSSCHMAAQPRTGEFNAITGHSFDVNTTLLTATDRLIAPPEQQCGTCHQDLAGTIAATTGQLEADLVLGREMEGEAEQALTEAGLQDDQLAADFREGSSWLAFVDTAEAGLHNPDGASDRLRDAIARFDEVKSQAYQQGGDGSDGTTTTTIGPAPTTTTPTPTATATTETETPGPGIAGVVTVLFALALLAFRRHG